MNIKELAEQAGLIPMWVCVSESTGSQVIKPIDEQIIERFAELVAAAERQASAKRYHEIMHDVVTEAVAKEREACAQLCEDASHWDGHIATQCAQRIRARGDKHD